MSKIHHSKERKQENTFSIRKDNSRLHWVSEAGTTRRYFRTAFNWISWDIQLKFQWRINADRITSFPDPVYSTYLAKLHLVFHVSFCISVLQILPSFGSTILTCNATNITQIYYVQAFNYRIQKLVNPSIPKYM